MRKACEDSHQSNLANVQNLVSELNVQPMETPLHATQEALSMLEAYLNIYSTRRQRKFNSNDLKTKEPNVFPKSSCVIPDEKFAVKKEPLQTDQRRVHKTSVNDDEKLNTAMVAKECFDVQKRCQNQSLHSNTNSMNSGDACLLRNEKPEVGCPHIQLTKGSLHKPQKIVILIRLWTRLMILALVPCNRVLYML
ncbi:unnamed protein product [Heterobilharzia americana]|nr:unnamed protein product [Heterobilharzia americana]